MIRTRVIALVALVLVVAGSAWAQSGADEATLKKRFEQRYLTLLRLKDQGKVGETSTGFAEAVQPAYLAEQIDVDKKSGTISTFLSEENSDRRQLYMLIAKRSGAQEDLVARRNAQRSFAKARPNDYLKLPDGRWVQQKNLHQEARTKQNGTSR